MGLFNKDFVQGPPSSRLARILIPRLPRRIRRVEPPILDSKTTIWCRLQSLKVDHLFRSVPGSVSGPRGFRIRMLSFAIVVLMRIRSKPASYQPQTSFKGALNQFQRIRIYRMQAAAIQLKNQIRIHWESGPASQLSGGLWRVAWHWASEYWIIILIYICSNAFTCLFLCLSVYVYIYIYGYGFLFGLTVKQLLALISVEGQLKYG